jgi:TonB family protein
MATPVKYRNGLIGTIVFHGALLFLLIFMAFRTPLPLPEEQGILVDFGNSNQGWGAMEPRPSNPAPTVQPQPTVVQPTPAKETILTQEHEESVAIPEKPKTKPKPVETPREQPRETPVEQPKPVAETPKPVERTVNQQAMYPGRGDAASTASSQGEAGGAGNQGATTGSPNVHVYGEGSGDGHTFALTGRGLQGRLPLPQYNSQEQGRVVVEITVDKDGNVIDATAGIRGSTTLDNTLLDAALKAAKQAKFSRKPDSPVQKGTITYVFKIQGE